jgi:two-component system, OmpR family, response regulator
MIDAIRSNPDITTRLATKSLRDRFMSAEAGHIIVVDDDSTLRQMVIRYLEDHDVPTRAASSKEELKRHLEGAEPSLIILDLRLGQDDGLDLLREIRSYSDVPVIITTGHRPDEIDRIVGLELGADDYIIKPFSLRELLARVRAVLRRQEMGRAARARDPERGGYRFNGWTLERRGRKLLDANSSPVALSKGEYALLLAFLEAPQRPLTREHLLQATRVHEDIFDRSIDVQVLRLRRKLETDPSAPRIIQTERGVGYVFALPVEPFENRSSLVRSERLLVAAKRRRCRTAAVTVFLVAVTAM